MNKLFSALVGVLFTSVASSGYASNWQKVGVIDTSFGETTIEVDGSSIISYPTYLELWVIFSFPAQIIKGEKMASSMMYIQVACANRKWRTLSREAYERPRANGKLLASSEEETAWTTIKPDTPAAIIHSSICPEDE